MDISEFTLQRIFFEARFEKAFSLWDRHGYIWNELRQSWGTVEPQKAEPNNTVFKVAEKFIVSTNIDRYSIGLALPGGDLTEFSKHADQLAETVSTALDLREYTRLGLRAVYWRPSKDLDTAATDLQKANLIRLPAGRHFGIDPVKIVPEIAFRWEGKDNGVSVRVRAEEEHVQIEPLIEMIFEDVRSVDVKRARTTLDVDYYTHAKVLVGQFRPRMWIENAAHVIRRDSRTLLGG